MCGIVGVVHQKGGAVSPPLLRKMTDTIVYRGPDDQGTYTDGSVGLGHRRLSILDLSAAGRQPMANEAGDVVLVYNGEIYNFQTLRVELQAMGYRFQSQTDTEVIVHAYEAWGEDCVHRFNGMFAFAVYDRKRNHIFCARDRYGIKPLYWFFENHTFLFASEIKALLVHPHVKRQVCLEGLNEYFTFQNILSDKTLFKGIRLLPPGTTLVLPLSSGSDPILKRYWDFSHPSSPSTASRDETEEQVYQLFTQAVDRQLVSDVPVGSYLSGGMDSGSIVAVARETISRLTTFTGGFDLSSASGLELGFDERENAEFIANLLKTEHYEMVLHAGDMEYIMPKLIWHLEDLRVGQCYPNYYLARLASRFVKVVTSGTGGDELFGGYPWRYYKGMDSTGQDDYYQKTYGFWQRLVPDAEKQGFFVPDVTKNVPSDASFDVFRDVYKGWAGGYKTKEDFIQASLYFELKTFLHGLLVVEDKLSMAHSLEARVPFLDNDLVDFAMRIPVSLKLEDLDPSVTTDENVTVNQPLHQLKTNKGKAILRQAMNRLIPEVVTQRTKQGFSAPDASWFRGESINYINNLFLRDPRTRLYDYISKNAVQKILEDHCSARHNKRLLIWSLLSFEWWLRQFDVG